VPFKIIRNDITKVKADVIVNTANLHPTCAAGTDAAIYKAAESDAVEWIDSLGLPESEVRNVGEFDFESKIVLLNSGYERPIMGLGTYSLTD